MKNIRLIVIAIVVITAAYITYGYLTAVPLPDDVTFQKEYKMVLQDYDGKEAALEQFRGRVLVVYTWATWCPYCTDELKNLATLKETYGDSIEIIAVNRAEPPIDVRPFTDNLGLQDRITFLMDSTDSLYKEIAGYAMPETLFINARGEVVFHQRGPIIIDEVRQQVSKMLK